MFSSVGPAAWDQVGAALSTDHIPPALDSVLSLWTGVWGSADARGDGQMSLSRHSLPRAKEVIHGRQPELLKHVGIYEDTDLLSAPPNIECLLHASPC